MLTLVTVEISQILEKLVSVAHQNLDYGPSLVRIGNKHLQETWTASSCCKRATSLKLAIIATGGPAYLRTIIQPQCHM